MMYVVCIQKFTFTYKSCGLGQAKLEPSHECIMWAGHDSAWGGSMAGAAEPAMVALAVSGILKYNLHVNITLIDLLHANLVNSQKLMMTTINQ